ncbi:MAG: hypothetical protein H9W81_07845 [Enterococcus sp.]|nr:hypothetical protein [Enterococcus sp.]
MKNPFKKAEKEPEFLQARDMNTFAFHIQRNGQDEPLCGTKRAMYPQYETSVQKVMESAELQHDGWYWCPACASALTGETPEFFREARFTSGR